MDPPGIHVLSRNPDVYLNFTLSRSIDSLLPLPRSILLPLNLARERNAMPQLSRFQFHFTIRYKFKEERFRVLLALFVFHSSFSKYIRTVKCFNS